MTQKLIFALLTLVVSVASADESAAERGYRFLIQQPVLSSDFTQEVFDEVWQVWPKSLREQAAHASKEERLRMAFERYGLTTRPDDDSGKPLQYVVDAKGTWTMNCFSCHGGRVYGSVTPGSPNNRFALQTMTEELRTTKFRLGIDYSRMDVGAMVIPLGTTHGTTNAVVFGVGLMSQRDEQLNLINAPPAKHVHHDMDAPPWWHFYKRPYIYIDGFAQKGHRGLMQFMLIPENGPQYFRDHENDFRDVFAYLSSLRPPKYTATIDRKLAEKGRTVFNQSCAECHGSYGDDWTYPNRRIPIDEIGTDPVRLTALSVAGRRKYANSWFANGGEPNQQATVIDPDGYVAPPLDGVWASAPYFHNGSVPTLWHVLHPAERPTIWTRVEEALDSEKVGLRIKEVKRFPHVEPDIAIKRSHFDTRRKGKSNAGHEYPNSLDENQKRAVLEYLKTL